MLAGIAGPVLEVVQLMAMTDKAGLAWKVGGLQLRVVDTVDQTLEEVQLSEVEQN